jgi:hypothetical protein
MRWLGLRIWGVCNGLYMLRKENIKNEGNAHAQKTLSRAKPALNPCLREKYKGF